MTRTVRLPGRARLLLPLSLLALLPAALPAASPQNIPPGAHFKVEQDGKTLGAAEYSLAPVDGGWTLHSTGSMKLDKFSYNFSEDQTVDGSLNFVRSTLTGSVNGEKAHADNVGFNATTDATGRSVAIQINDGSQNQSNSVDRHRNMVLMADLDPAAYTLMAHLAEEKPKTAWVLIPKQTGLLVPVDYRKGPDLHGTLGGAPVAVRHYVATVGVENALTIDLYGAADGALLEADLDAQNLHVVRDGFQLLDRPKPAAQVPGQAPGQGPGQAPAQGTAQPGVPPTPPAPPQP